MYFVVVAFSFNYEKMDIKELTREMKGTILANEGLIIIIVSSQ